MDCQDAGKVDRGEDEVKNVITRSCPDVDQIGKAGICCCGILVPFLKTAFVLTAVGVQYSVYLGIKIIVVN